MASETTEQDECRCRFSGSTRGDMARNRSTSLCPIHTDSSPMPELGPPICSICRGIIEPADRCSEDVDGSVGLHWFCGYG